MKSIFIILTFALISLTAFAQTLSETPIQNISTDSAVVYRLFTTKNKWTYIKLNTRNGQMWQVPLSILISCASGISIYSANSDVVTDLASRKVLILLPILIKYSACLLDAMA